jgi:hypothetical protein
MLLEIDAQNLDEENRVLRILMREIEYVGMKKMEPLPDLK